MTFFQKKLPKIFIFFKEIAIGNFFEKNENFWQFFLKKCQIFDSQMAIFRRVRFSQYNVLVMARKHNYESQRNMNIIGDCRAGRIFSLSQQDDELNLVLPFHIAGNNTIVTDNKMSFLQLREMVSKLWTQNGLTKIV